MRRERLTIGHRPSLVALQPFAAACLLALASACSGPRLEGARTALPADASDLTPWLEAGPVIDADHPAIERLAAELTGDAPDDRSAAIAIHDFVRDGVPFGFTSDFYELRASEVLEVGEGYCLTKGTLFVALLRAAEIPARQHFVDVNADLLRGIASPPTDFMDQAFTEVWLDGRWVRVDSYILDAPYFEQAQARLLAEGRRIGYGTHVAGVPEWDGAQDSFSQFVDDGSVEDFSRHDWGLHPDVMAFYRDEPGAWSKRTAAMSLLASFGLGPARRRVERMRSGDD